MMAAGWKDSHEARHVTGPRQSSSFLRLINEGRRSRKSTSRLFAMTAVKLQPLMARHGSTARIDAAPGPGTVGAPPYIASRRARSVESEYRSGATAHAERSPATPRRLDVCAGLEILGGSRRGFGKASGAKPEADVNEYERARKLPAAEPAPHRASCPRGVHYRDDKRAEITRWSQTAIEAHAAA